MSKGKLSVLIRGARMSLIPAVHGANAVIFVWNRLCPATRMTVSNTAYTRIMMMIPIILISIASDVKDISV
jgi:hypothetical protein